MRTSLHAGGAAANMWLGTVVCTAETEKVIPHTGKQQLGRYLQDRTVSNSVPTSSNTSPFSWPTAIGALEAQPPVCVYDCVLYVTYIIL